MQKIDETTRHDAAILHADGDTKGATASLIKRINDSNGHCDVKVWLCALDVYQIQKQHAAYEKIAVFFANRFHFSAPAWEQQEAEKKQAGQWRNALIVEGSPLTIHSEKVRDFVKASKEAKESRMDLSRMRIVYPDGTKETLDVMESEAEQLFDIMLRLRRAKCPTLLMGETEILRLLQKTAQEILQKQYQHQAQPGPDSPIWLLLFEILQWRGLEVEFNALAMDFAEHYNYCPLGYDPEMRIAITPSRDNPSSAFVSTGTNENKPENGENIEGHFEEKSNMSWKPEETILDSSSLMRFVENQWAHEKDAIIDFSSVHRISFDAAQNFASFLQALHFAAEDADPKQPSLEPVVILKQVNEIVGAVLEIAGISAFCQIEYKHEKFRHLLEQ